MKDRPDSAWVVAPGDELCLDFANTRFWRGTATPTETLASTEDLLAWCSEKAGLPAEIVRGVAEKAGPAALLAQALSLRETLYRLLHAVAARGAAAQADLEAFNAALAWMPPRRAVAALPDRFGWQVTEPPKSVAGLLAPVLWSAADLLVSRRITRLRHCANPQCHWLFLDDSKSGNRRWCSMSACGNRAKAHRHYIKQKRNRGAE